MERALRLIASHGATYTRFGYAHRLHALDPSRRRLNWNTVYALEKRGLVERNLAASGVFATDAGQMEIADRDREERGAGKKRGCLTVLK